MEPGPEAGFGLASASFAFSKQAVILYVSQVPVEASVVVSSAIEHVDVPLAWAGT